MAAAVLVAVSFAAVREFSAVDGFLDGGGEYDYVAAACRHYVDKLPVISRPWLSTPDFGSMRAALVVTVAFIAIFAIRDRTTRVAG
jgi:hypothetical protein